MSPPDRDGLVTYLTGRFTERFDARIPAWRYVGREAELILVDQRGRAADAQAVLRMLLDEGGCTPQYVATHAGPRGLLVGVEAESWVGSVEVGRATIEIAVGPRRTLFELESDMGPALGRVARAANRLGMRVLGHGIQPRTPPGAAMMSPKPRYFALLKALGAPWLRWTVTASDQVQVDVGVPELASVTNVMNALSGALIALTANSAIYGGRRGGYVSGREGLMAATSTEPQRVGMPPRPFSAVEDYIELVLGLRCLMLPDDTGGFRIVDGAFTEAHLGDMDGDALFEAFLFHEHYVWPSARPRARIGTLEIRPVCQQPWDAHWLAPALSLGLVERAGDVAGYLDEALGKTWWDALRAYRRTAVVAGMSAPEPAPGFLHTVAEIARRGLEQRGCGEEALLDAAFERIERRAGPADAALSCLQAHGMDAVVDMLEVSIPD
ncbi:hypothetical protein BH24ACT26_BH24ACT26_06270 [soil metagenome]